MTQKNEKIDTKQIELLIKGYLEVHDDALNRLSLTLDKREREDWIILIKEQLNNIENVLNQLPKNTIKIVRPVSVQ